MRYASGIRWVGVGVYLLFGASSAWAGPTSAESAALQASINPFAPAVSTTKAFGPPEQLPPPPPSSMPLPLATPASGAPVWIGKINGQQVYKTSSGFILEDKKQHAEPPSPR